MRQNDYNNPIMIHEIHLIGAPMNQTKLTFSVFKGVEQRLKKSLDQLFIKRDGFIEHLINTELPNLKDAMAGLKNSPSARAFINKSMDKKRLTTTITVVVKKSLASKLKQVIDEHNLSRDAFINRMLIFTLLNAKQLEALGIERTASEIESRIDFVDAIPTSPMEAFSYWMDDPLFLIRESLKLTEENMYLIDLDCLKSNLNTMTACYFPNEQLPDPKFDELVNSILLDDFLPEAL